MNFIEDEKISVGIESEKQLQKQQLHQYLSILAYEFLQ